MIELRDQFAMAVLQGELASQDTSNGDYYDFNNERSLTCLVENAYKVADAMLAERGKAQAIPEGFVLVPKEPTQELLNKMQDFFCWCFREWFNRRSVDSLCIQSHDRSTGAKQMIDKATN